MNNEIYEIRELNDALSLSMEQSFVCEESCAFSNSFWAVCKINNIFSDYLRILELLIWQKNYCNRWFEKNIKTQEKSLLHINVHEKYFYLPLASNF